LDTRAAPWTVSDVSTNTLFGTETDAWSTNLIWGAIDLQNLTPDNAVSGSNIVWGTNIVRGTVWGTNIVSGTNIVWGTGLVSDDSATSASSCDLEACF
jgi:hypothetical protein